jgi:hypothetical protein
MVGSRMHGALLFGIPIDHPRRPELHHVGELLSASEALFDRAKLFA